MDPEPPPDVLVVDDDEDIRVSLDRGLRLSGFRVRLAADGEAALRAVEDRAPDCIVLDVGLPGRDGIRVVDTLRRRGVPTPVCMLSARTSVDDRVTGLAAGADDYLVKPFALTELVARLRALLRRVPAAPSGGLSVGPLVVDPARRTASVAGVPVELTRREFDLAETLARNAGLVLSRERLLELVWGYDFAVDTNVVDVFVSQLRRKLEAGGTPRLVHTVRGIGFRLEAPAGPGG
ncbi:response regulator transcription factor [Geodermatophilus sp. DSM 44513]|uniref:response regulator transcription factor n=1 Tax=Geodermatophilus sp. DSM 44513 TaxID=1528104 RepID=UPI00127E2FA6|nr:response regulator transcription factor [Geodermatophilus sp. DSM 44513]WNV77461.1 response regulator transcription factor [Geodermatophilus sp. DSM 44513]